MQTTKKTERSYTFEEYRREIYPISLEDLLDIKDPEEFGRRLIEELHIFYTLD